MKKDDLTAMQKEELTAAQRIMLAQGKGIYAPKESVVTFSERTHFIFACVVWLAFVAAFVYQLFNQVFLQNAGYATVLVMGVYVVLVAKHVKYSWHEWRKKK